jgi:hypothetical protein
MRQRSTEDEVAISLPRSHPYIQHARPLIVGSLCLWGELFAPGAAPFDARKLQMQADCIKRVYLVYDVHSILK